jgi:hypothetical protein
MDDIPHPVDVNRRILAVILEKRDRNTRNRRRFHVGKGTFQH